jgi:hypothetical protein
VPPDAGRTPPSLRRRIRAAFTERLGYKAAALFFALVLWLIVRFEEPSEELVPVQLVTVFDSGRTLVGSRPQLRALVVGRARDLIKLYDAPPTIRRVITEDSPDTVRLELRPADVLLRPGTEALVRDVQPRSVLLTFDVREQRRVPVRSLLRIAVATEAPPLAEPRIEPESVTVSGARSRVRRIEDVPTHSQSVLLRDTSSVLLPLDTAGLGVRVRPAHVRVFAPLSTDRAAVAPPRVPPPTTDTTGLRHP